MNGVWIGTMSEEQKKQGGIWVMGNSPYNSDPNYPGRNDGSILVKSWIANPDKYGDSGYKPKDRIHENRWEYVRVFAGCLECVVGDGDEVISSPLEYPDEGVELRPETLRRWRLYSRHTYAAGIAICRTLSTHPHKAGWGPNYEYATWDSRSRVSAEVLAAPRNRQQKWKFRYVEVFEGTIEFTAESTSHIMRRGEHAFLPLDLALSFDINVGNHSKGIVMYF